MKGLESLEGLESLKGLEDLKGLDATQFRFWRVQRVCNRNIKTLYFKFLLIVFKGLGGFGEFEWFGGFRQ